jgi:hypothetical protein
MNLTPEKRKQLFMFLKLVLAAAAGAFGGPMAGELASQLLQILIG